MKRLKTWKKAAIGLLVLSGVTTFAMRKTAAQRFADLRAKGSDVPTFTVKKEPFVRKVTADGYLKAVKSTPLAAPIHGDNAQKIAWLAPDGSYVKKGDVVVRFDPSEFEKKLRDGQADRSSAEAKIAKEGVLADSAMRGRDRQANLSQVELDEQKKLASTDPLIFSRNAIIESGIDEKLSSARLTHAGSMRTIETTLSKSKIDLIGVEKKKADLHVHQASEALQTLEIRAPHDGILVLESTDGRGNLPHVGDSVWGGQTIGSLPLLDEMEAEVFILEADASGVQVGNVASVVLEAHPDPGYEAKVRRMDALAKPRMRENPIQYFGASLTLAKTDKELMKPGERVRTTLTLDTKDALAVPRQCVFEKEGKTIVYRQTGAKTEPVTVKLGASTVGLVVIEEGIREGDHIALRDPSAPASAAGSAKPDDKPAAGSGASK